MRIAPEQWLGVFGLACTTLMLVVFLIIFVITPMIDLPPFIDFPSASSAVKSPDREYDVHVSIRADGTMFVGTDPTLPAALPRVLGHSRRSGADLRLRVDRATPYRFVRRVVLAARDAGYERVTLAVRREPRVRFTAPAVTHTPQCPTDNLLAESLWWLDRDIHSRFRVTIDARGRVTATELLAMTPAPPDLASRLELHQARCLRATRFAAPASAPYTFEIAMRLAAPR